MHSSGHAQGSNETHEESVALLLDVLTKIYSNMGRQTERQRETLSTRVDAGILLLQQMFSLCAVFPGNIETFPQGWGLIGESQTFISTFNLTGVTFHYVRVKKSLFGEVKLYIYLKLCYNAIFKH